MSWRIYYDLASGKRLNEDDPTFVPVAVRLHAITGLLLADDDFISPVASVLELAQRPDNAVKIWDVVTRNYIDKPPPVLRDLVAELAAKPLVQAILNDLTAQQRLNLRQYIRDWLDELHFPKELPV